MNGVAYPNLDIVEEELVFVNECLSDLVDYRIIDKHPRHILLLLSQ